MVATHMRVISNYLCAVGTFSRRNFLMSSSLEVLLPLGAPPLAPPLGLPFLGARSPALGAPDTLWCAVWCCRIAT